MSAARPDWRAYWKDRMVVYRCYDASGVLLYIGATRNWPIRMQTHRYRPTSFWWPLVHKVRITLSRRPSEAEWVEKLAIRTEKPLYNLVENIPPADRAAKILEWDRQFPGTAEAFRKAAEQQVERSRKRKLAKQGARTGLKEKQ